LNTFLGDGGPDGDDADDGADAADIVVATLANLVTMPAMTVRASCTLDAARAYDKMAASSSTYNEFDELLAYKAHDT